MDKDNTNSTINELLKVIDEQTFTKLVNVIDLDKYVKKVTAYKFFQLLIIAQMNELDSLTHLSKFTKDKEDLHIHIGLDGISTSQLSRKQSTWSPRLFEKIFHHLVLEIQSQMKQAPIVRDIRRLHVIDSSTMSMSITQYPWATFRKTKAGVRLHLRVVVTKDLTVPDKAVLLSATHADRTQMNELIEIDPDALYLFDRGYVDYKQFDQFRREGLRFITRLKKNAEIEVLAEQTPDPDNLIYQDAEVFLGKTQTGTKMEYSLQLIKTKDSEGNLVIIVTSCFDLTAKEIADLYRYRWKIETFFKWMKQHLKITSFYGKSENAVYNQIWIAMITYCLEVLLQLKVGYTGTLLELKRTLEIQLFKGLDAFIRTLFRKPTRSSKGRKKTRWEEEFRVIERQFDEGEVSHLNDVSYDPMF
ncbi:IS4 family transposase [Peribacillus cavernae]|uniref:IS4 family transposase n=1 Tax=Peribacillus cavernae TaxID=1674310 RepID=A0A433HRB8_9BACI|nr:IS4 family transposase [Peribacillus cavernae]MDQ0218655.1 IS4 transposase [Peribacillus cavernae]RUQ30881.1 IS4 family transposase [Peribacillus cavernae]